MAEITRVGNVSLYGVVYTPLSVEDGNAVLHGRNQAGIYTRVVLSPEGRLYDHDAGGPFDHEDGPDGYLGTVEPQDGAGLAICFEAACRSPVS